MLPGSWIERASGNKQPFLLWPPRSPDITPCDFWGVWEICQRPGIYPLIAHDLADQKAWIIAALKNIDAPMLMCVWQEPEYRIDVCRVTRGAHIEHL